MAASLGPRVVVMHDVDEPRGQGAYWGEVQANIHRALGCLGVVTDGTVRDLPEAEAVGFQFFSAHVSVSHAYVHMVDFGIPVKVGGLVDPPGDLLHGDQHGVVVVPWTSPRRSRRRRRGSRPRAKDDRGLASNPA